MFDIGWGEMVVIGIVALIAIGPKELPTVLRTLGQWTGKIRRMAGEFQGQFQEALREAEISDLKKQFDDAANSVNTMAGGLTGGATTFDPVASAKKEIESAFDTYSDASSKPAATPPTDSQIPSEATPAAVTSATSEAVSLPPPEAPVPPPAVNIDIPVPEPAPLDPVLTPSADTAPAAKPPAATPPKEAGA